MKKGLLILSALILIGAYSFKVNAQAFQQGKIAITAGYGFPNLGKSLLSAYEGYVGYEAFGVGPVHVRGEFGLSDKIGMAVSVNYVSMGARYTHTGFDNNNNQVTYSDELKYSSYSVLGRLNIHFATTDKLDPYWGIGAGYRGAAWTYSSTDPGYNWGTTTNAIPLGFETTVGLRYYFTPNIGMYTELGLAKSVIQAGLSIAL